MTRKSAPLAVAPAQVSLHEAATIVATIGATVTVCVRSAPGQGKTRGLLALLTQMLPTHRVIKTPIDAAMFAPEDHAFPVIDKDASTFSAAVNARYGLIKGDNTPVVLLLDELLKAKGPALNALLPVAEDRRVGDWHLPAGSIVCAASNLDTDGVGDTCPAHAYSRMMVVDMRNGTGAEFVDNVAPIITAHPAVVGFAQETPQAFVRYDDTTALEEQDNPLIFNPLKGRTKGYVCPRTLHKASDFLWSVDRAEQAGNPLTPNAVLAGLIGLVGEAGGRDLASRYALLDSLPRISQIVTDPSRAPLPGSPAALYQMAWSLAGHLTTNTVDAICTYVMRWPGREPQALFAEMLARRPQVLALSAPARTLLASLASVMRKVA